MDEKIKKELKEKLLIDIKYEKMFVRLCMNGSINGMHSLKCISLNVPFFAYFYLYFLNIFRLTSGMDPY